jgi:hypothetical protein
MKIFARLFLLAVLTAGCVGQIFSCALTLKDAPELRGLRLGMSVEEINSILQINMAFSEEETNFTINENNLPIFKQANIGEKKFETSRLKDGNFEGVKKLTLSFFENKLISMRLIYSASYVEWKDSADFQRYLSEKLKLPKESWSEKGMHCKEFYVGTDVYNTRMYGYEEKDSAISLVNSLMILKMDELAKQKYMENQKNQTQIQEDKKKNFKP